MTETFERCAPWVCGAALSVQEWLELKNPYTGETVTQVARSDAEVTGRAVAAAEATQKQVEAIPAHARAAVLRRAADLVEERTERYAERVTRQTGKALRNTLREVRRSALTFRAAATAAESLNGTVHNAEVSPDGQGLMTMTIRQPVGVIGAITPFNAPFNLVVHKVAPAFAAGNAIVIKPSDQAPLSAIDVARLMEDAGAPPGAVNIVPGGAEAGAALVGDPRVRMLTFTGGRAAGAAIHAAAGLRPLTLELGGNSPNIVHHDADLDTAAKACVQGGFSNTGQSCNSVQRIIVHQDVADQFVKLVSELVGQLVVGDPADPDTDVGTLVDVGSAERVEAWLREAESGGARVLPEISRNGAQLRPAIVVGASLESRIVCEEIFGPVVVIQTYDGIDEAIELANNTPYGLQSAIFTASLDVAMRAMREMDAGAVLVNRSSNFRMDHLPYGGVKESGLGREGPAQAVHDMTVEKLLVVAPAREDV